MKYYKVIIHYKANNLVQDYTVMETFDYDLAYSKYNEILNMSNSSIVELYLYGNLNIKILEKTLSCYDIDGDSYEVHKGR